MRDVICPSLFRAHTNLCGTVISTSSRPKKSARGLMMTSAISSRYPRTPLQLRRLPLLHRFRTYSIATNPRNSPHRLPRRSRPHSRQDNSTTLTTGHLCGTPFDPPSPPRFDLPPISSPPVGVSPSSNPASYAFTNPLANHNGQPILGNSGMLRPHSV